MRDRVVAKIRRDKEGNWLVSFPDIPGAHTYGRSLKQLRRRIAEVLRLWDRDPARTQVLEILQPPSRLKKAIDRATRQRQDLENRTRKVRLDLEQTIDRLQSTPR